MRAFITTTAVVLLYFAAYSEAICPSEDDLTFELSTGFVFTSPDRILDTRPGVLLLESCLAVCRQNASCRAVNYEVGLCVLFASSAQQNPGKPKICLKVRAS